jgi:phosphatidylglycerophosphate synthase
MSINTDNDYVYKYYKKKGIVDKFLFEYLTDYPVDLSYKYNLTPNVLTTISLVLQYSSVQLLYLNFRVSYFILYVLGYYFDCIDGPMARRYNMVTTFGDFYDHSTDIFCYILSLNYYVNYLNLLNNPVITSIYTLFFLCLMKHVGCQEKIFNSNLKNKKEISMTLYLPVLMVGDAEKEMKYFRHTGFTVFVLFHASIPLLI